MRATDEVKTVILDFDAVSLEDIPSAPVALDALVQRVIGPPAVSAPGVNFGSAI